MNLQNNSNLSQLIPLSEMMSVSEYFKGKHIFITGATGFMGKVLVEKLLWEIEDLGNIYILIRAKKGVDPKERIDRLLLLPAFDRLRLRNPKVFSKIIPIEGDVIEENLGISDYDRKMLESNVSIILHAASSVRFDDPLKKGILLNVRGTREVMELAKNVKNLQVVTYVSTTFCNSDKRIIEEQIYPINYDWKLMIKLAETTDENLLNILQPKIINKKPNTYTFTKHLAETVIRDYSINIPSVVYRPSIVVFSIKDPLPGWIDSFNGPMGLAAGVESGVLHVLYGEISFLPDFIPCDYAINGLIAATWYKGISKSKKCEIVNGASGGKKKTSMNFMAKLSKELLEKSPPSQSLWFPSYVVTKSRLIYYLMTIFTHIIPGMLIDIILKLKGVNFSLMKVYRKIFIANQALEYFMMNEWKFLTNNYDAILKLLPEDDKKHFNYDISLLEEDEAMLIGMKGYKKYLQKIEVTEASISADKIRFNRMSWLHKITKVILFIITSWMVVKFFKAFILPYLNDIFLLY